MKSIKQRFWEIDFLRGIAIVMMIIFHLMFDLAYFGSYSINVSSGFWLYFARATALMFIFLVGISLALSFSKAGNLRKWRIKNLKRGLVVFFFGLIITLITWLFLREEFIIFGILHFIGISIIISMFFIDLKHWNLLLGIFLISLGIWLSDFTFNFPWLLWLGFQPASFYTLDYYPLLPWFGVVLIGIYFGGLLYKKNTRKFKIPDFSKSLLVKLFGFLGRNSLLIYLMHQPILIVLLYVLGIVKSGFL
ncbi:MAG TPA: heparan-alpha-glucosaminide N-acetyltransferase [Candidatus Nanoarchaeia archaeon]|nr:heparan-alpha-glucosaminide N-acetyltransferase [Candidatus Nanoarchaeia archaeon]